MLAELSEACILPGDQRGRRGAGALQSRGGVSAFHSVKLHRPSREQQVSASHIGQDSSGQSRTALRCCYKPHTLLFMLLFCIFLSQLWCSPLTWTPAMSLEKTGKRAVSSAFLWPCTGNSTRIKGCEYSMAHVSISNCSSSLSTLEVHPR